MSDKLREVLKVLVARDRLLNGDHSLSGSLLLKTENKMFTGLNVAMGSVQSNEHSERLVERLFHLLY